MANPSVSIIQACKDPDLFQPWFKDAKSWDNWFAFLKCVFALPTTIKDREAFTQFTKRDKLPEKPVTEAWLVVGRRGGKSFILALIAVFLACFKDWRPFLTPGEYGTIMVIAQDRPQARIIFRYIKSLINNIPLLKKRIRGDTAESIELQWDVVIEVRTASFRGVRGYTIIAALLDEIAFWKAEDSANPDTEVINALEPGMVTIPGAMLLCASSPYAKRGVLYDTWKTYFGQDDPDILVWQADTLSMHPTVSQKKIDRAYQKDSTKAAAEYGAQFREDIETFLTSEVIDAITIIGRIELPPVFNMGFRYYGFTDPSGGSKDSFTLAVGHLDDGIRVLDLIREVKPPFKPDKVTEGFADILKSYHITQVVGDRYGGEWPRERFRDHGISYKVCEKTKSDIYRDVLSVFTSEQVELLDVKRMSSQFVNLERRTVRGGKDSIDHSPNGRDDVSNAVAGVLDLMSPRTERWDPSDCHVGTRLKSSSIEFLDIGGEL